MQDNLDSITGWSTANNMNLNPKKGTVKVNQWLNWFPLHHPYRPYRPNCSKQIGRSRIRSFVFAMFSSSHA